MKNAFYTILLFAALCGGLASCTGGDYNANPNSNANLLVNPANPLTASEFTWGVGNTGAMGGVINGSGWATNNVSYGFTNGGNVLIGVLGSKRMYLFLANTWAGNIYNMGFHQYNSECILSDSVGGQYKSYYSSAGNSGEVIIIQNDSLAIKGMFYCEAISPTGEITAINNGYFNVSKVP